MGPLLRGRPTFIAVVLTLLAFAGMAFYAMSAEPERFAWLPGDSAPNLYPVVIVDGDFYFDDGSRLYIPSGRTVAAGWGVATSTDVVGERLKLVPERLTLRWFSYVEDRFYQGDFELPKDAIAEGFRRELPGVGNGMPPTRFSRLVVGMAPEGHVVLWLGGGGHRMEVAHFRAEVVQLSWNVLETGLTRQAVIEMVLDETLDDEERAELASIGAMAEGRYERLHRRYNVGFDLEGVHLGERAYIESFNGEQTALAFNTQNNPTLPAKDRGLPMAISYRWLNEEGQRFVVKAILEERETLAAVESLGGLSARGALVFRLRLDNLEPSIRLVREDEERLLDAVNFSVYRSRR